MKFSISFKYSNVTFKNKETKETISYDTKADGNTFTFDNVDEDIVLGIVKGIKDRKASQVFSYDDFRTNFINVMARNKCKELYDKLDKGEWKIGDISISSITIKDLEFTKPTMNARETITVESISKKNYPKGGYPTYVVKERLVDLIEGCPRENPMWADLVEILEKYYGEAEVEKVMGSRKRMAESYWMTDYKWNQPYEVVFTDGSSFTVPGKTEDPINFYRHYNNKSYEDIMRKTYGSGLELGKEIDHFNMPNGNVITRKDMQDEDDFYHGELKAKHSFQETSRMESNEFKPGDLVDWFVPEDDDRYGEDFGGEVFHGGEVYKRQGDVYEVNFGEEGMFYPFAKDLEPYDNTYPRTGHDEESMNESSVPLEPVIFKKDRKDGTVVAFFPETLRDGSCNPGKIMSYEHNGQHGEASIEYFHECRPCSEEEYADLLTELEDIYTDGLKVVKRMR